jgi:5-methylcytosine-specific restriction protein B
MSLDSLLEVIYDPNSEDWTKRNETAFKDLFGSPNGRYKQSAERTMTLRAPAIDMETGVRYAAYIHPSNPTSGPYSGLSFVVFPAPQAPCLIGLVVGTQGLVPDETILGRPGHARKAQAICSWLNAKFGRGKQVAWAKQDPTRTDISVPDELRQKWSQYKNVFERYGKEMYALFAPDDDRDATREALAALLDLVFSERGFKTLAAAETDSEDIRAGWFEHLMPAVHQARVRSLLAERRFVILQGPPGTGKTTMAMDLLSEDYGGHGQTIQFHANTTYETFVGGLAPAHSADQLGLNFKPTPGLLMEAAAIALQDPSKPYLLHIDEINRADLSKVLGEAIFLLETDSKLKRCVHLPFDFGEPFHRTLFLPENLHIVGTMNSADRSIAIVDVAVRRRFGFVGLWPQMSVVEEKGSETTQKAFRDLVSIFIEHASDDSFSLVPGHSYFLQADPTKAKEHLTTNLVPLLEEYLSQGYVAGFAEPIRNFIQGIRSL